MRKREYLKIVSQQEDLASRELRYTVMRILRLVGWPIWALGMLGIFFGFAYGLGGLCFGDRYVYTSLIGLGSMAAGFAVLCLGHAVFDPYMFETNMPNKDGQSRCIRCGEEIQSCGVFFSCPKCRSFAPIPGKAILARLMGSWVTWVHAILLGAGILIAIS